MANFDQPLHAFRAFAIVNIVAVHALAIVQFPYPTPEAFSAYAWLRALNETAFHDSTIYFTLISGILFSQVLAERGWRVFFRSKVANVLLPYAVVTLLMTAFDWPRGYALFAP
jgi:surface polysaccharide O-acyltransferase-like enzyme